MTTLGDKILSREATVAVLGLGYVGLALAVDFASAGFTVLGIDISKEKVAQLIKGKSYVVDVEDSILEKVIRAGRLRPTLDYNELDSADVVIICVPTPLRKTREPDISYIQTAVKEIREHLHPGMLIVLESTTYPGTTEELIQEEVEKMGLRVGDDVFVCFSPERVDPGNKQFKNKNTPKVIGGVTKACVSYAEALYGTIVDRVVPVSSPRVAEMVKLLENTFRSVNIALVNEIAVMCDRMGIDVWEVISAAATKPFGYVPFYPGPGIGGHCIPLDPHYLSWRAKAFGFNSRFIELAADINGGMPRYVVTKVSEILNQRKKCLNGSKILILGVSYKRNVNDVRESPALEIIQLLQEQGCDVEYNDPYVPSLKIKGRERRSVSLDRLGDYDCVVLVTDHSCYDYEKITRQANMVFDTRNSFVGQKDNPGVFRLGAMGSQE